MKVNSKNFYLVVLYFFLSSLITWWFVDVSPLYCSLQQKLFSTCIAGAKWGLQIAAANFFMGNKKWKFIKNIGITCLLGSIVLLPYAIATSCGYLTTVSFFVESLLVAVIVKKI